MSAGLFQRLFAAAEGSLGSSRVRPQAAPAWAPDAPLIEPLPAEAPVAQGPVSRAEASGPPRAMAAPSVRPIRGPATVPPRLQPLNVSVLAADARQQAAEPPLPEPGAAPTRSAPPLKPAPASQQALAVPEATRPLPKPRERASPTALASEAEDAADSPPPLLQPPRRIDALAAPSLGPAAALPRPQPSPAAAAPAAEPTIVHVSIGRVEFLPAAPPSSRPRSAPRATTRVPLADYLSGKGS